MKKENLKKANKLVSELNYLEDEIESIESNLKDEDPPVIESDHGYLIYSKSKPYRVVDKPFVPSRTFLKKVKETYELLLEELKGYKKVLEEEIKDL